MPALQRIGEARHVGELAGLARPIHFAGRQQAPSGIQNAQLAGEERHRARHKYRRGRRILERSRVLLQQLAYEHTLPGELARHVHQDHPALENVDQHHAEQRDEDDEQPHVAEDQAAAERAKHAPYSTTSL